MTDEKKYFARVTSTNEIEFDFPYHGGSNFDIVARKDGKETDLMLTVTKGQFISSMGDEIISMKFDNGKVEKYYYTMAADGSADVIFFSNPAKIIKKLKGAKKVKIEAMFYDAGKKVIEFDVDGLKWNH